MAPLRIGDHVVEAVFFSHPPNHLDQGISNHLFVRTTIKLSVPTHMILAVGLELGQEDAQQRKSRKRKGKEATKGTPTLVLSDASLSNVMDQLPDEE